MDIQNLLCHTTTTYSNDQFQNLQYDKQAFEYCPSSPSAWSSVSSKSFMSEPILGMSASSNDLPNIITSNLNVHSVASSTVSTPTMTKNLKKQHHTRTPWTALEDDLLEKGYLQGLSWAMISAKYLPHRSRGCCWGRFKTLQAKSKERRKNWTVTEDKALINAIKKHTKLFKDAWKNVASDLNERDWRECETRSLRISSILNQDN